MRHVVIPKYPRDAHFTVGVTTYYGPQDPQSRDRQCGRVSVYSPYSCRDGFAPVWNTPACALRSGCESALRAHHAAMLTVFRWRWSSHAMTGPRHQVNIKLPLFLLSAILASPISCLCSSLTVCRISSRLAAILAASILTAASSRRNLSASSSRDPSIS